MGDHTRLHSTVKIYVSMSRKLLARYPRISYNSREMFRSRQRLAQLSRTFPDLQRRDNNVGTYALIFPATPSTTIPPCTLARSIAESSVYPGWKLSWPRCLHLPATLRASQRGGLRLTPMGCAKSTPIDSRNRVESCFANEIWCFRNCAIHFPLRGLKGKVSPANRMMLEVRRELLISKVVSPFTDRSFTLSL